MSTRVGSYDDEMYADYLASSDDMIYDNGLKLIEGAKRAFIEQINEQRIADSHDITKSNFGFDEK